MGYREYIFENAGRGEKYKLKIGKSLVTANYFSDFGDKKMMINYND